mmetsp:Transcript_28996/g.59409  ORF Transcript_28996/g.59409 Transcript_28996/m.59409 type:complete len:246 (-) Transcript_28996:912-1649(-)
MVSARGASSCCVRRSVRSASSSLPVWLIIWPSSSSRSERSRDIHSAVSDCSVAKIASTSSHATGIFASLPAPVVGECTETVVMRSNSESAILAPSSSRAVAGVRLSASARALGFATPHAGFLVGWTAWKAKRISARWSLRSPSSRDFAISWKPACCERRKAMTPPHVMVACPSSWLSPDHGTAPPRRIPYGASAKSGWGELASTETSSAQGTIPLNSEARPRSSPKKPSMTSAVALSSAGLPTHF